MAASPHSPHQRDAMNIVQNNLQVQDQYSGIKIKSQAGNGEQVDKLKQAHRLRSNQNASPDPLAFLSCAPTQATNGHSGVVKSNHTLDQVKVIVDEDGTTTVGNYKLGRDLGKGTFGKVRVGTHLLTDEKVAVKILEKDKIVDSADVDRVSREIHILKILRHPVVVQLYEIIESEKELFMIMEYARGGELFEYIVSHKRVREKEAARFLHQILSGIEYLHKLGICHRDLKPENLLMDDYNNIKIVDFGLSNTYKPGETLKTACGSPCYAAPEMVAGKKYDGLPADIWSCGVILYAMVCGYLPFEDPKTNLLYKKILNAEYTIPDFVSPDCADLIRKILNTDPAQRYTLQDIKSHIWLKQIKNQKDYSGIIIGQNPIPYDQQIIEQIVTKYKLPKSYKDAKQEIQMNRHNGFTTAYYLTLKRFIRQGGKSIADVTKYNAEKIQAMINEEQISQAIVVRPQQHMRNNSDYQSHQIGVQGNSQAVHESPQFISSQTRLNQLIQQQEQHARGSTSNNRNRNPAKTNLIGDSVQKKGINFQANGPPSNSPQQSPLNKLNTQKYENPFHETSVMESTTTAAEAQHQRTKTQDGPRNKNKLPSNRLSIEGNNGNQFNGSQVQNQVMFPQRITNFNQTQGYPQPFSQPLPSQQPNLAQVNEQGSFEISSRISNQQRQLLQQTQQSNLIMKQQAAAMLPSKLTRQYLTNAEQNLPQVTAPKRAQILPNQFIASQAPTTQQFSEPKRTTAPAAQQPNAAPPGDFSYMYFTPRDLINFKGNAQQKFKFNSQNQHPRKASHHANEGAGDSSYIVAQSPVVQNQPGGIPSSSTMSRRPKLQQTFFKPAPKLIQQGKNPILSKSVNLNINESSGLHASQQAQQPHSQSKEPINRNSLAEMPATTANVGTNGKRHFLLQSSDFVQQPSTTQNAVSPYELSAALTSTSNQKSRMHQGTANSRFRQTSYNLQQNQGNSSGGSSPINVINNSLNITIYSGQNGKQTGQKSQQRSRTRAYYTDQLLNQASQLSPTNAAAANHNNAQ